MTTHRRCDNHGENVRATGSPTPSSPPGNMLRGSQIREEKLAERIQPDEHSRFVDTARPRPTKLSATGSAKGRPVTANDVPPPALSSTIGSAARSRPMSTTRREVRSKLPRPR
jgi:hypothetical protein